MRIWRWVAIAVAGGGLAACSSGSSAPTTSNGGSDRAATTTIAPTTTTPGAPNVQPLLLAVTDLPTGWSVDSNTTTPNSCYSGPLTKISPASYAHVDFAQGGSLPELIEQLAFSTSATNSFYAIKSTLDGCTTFTEMVGGKTISGNLGPMSFPSFGDQSAAFDATLSINGKNVNQGFVVAQKSNYLTVVALGDVGPLDSALLQQFITLALGKIPD